MNLDKSLQSALENIYISPLELCNLNCSYCYTSKTANILSNDQILNFVEKYSSYLRSITYDLKSILFCGGEVFTLPNFPNLINTLTQKDIFITIITNGTIDRLIEIEDPKNCQLLVSFDGPKEIHDQNRGSGNFDKSLEFVKHAQKLGFPIEIMFLITKDSYSYKDSFNVLNLPKTFLSDRKMSLSKEQLLDVKNNYKSYPDKNFGCFQLSLQSDGKITGCCESEISLGNITDDPQIYIQNFIKSLSKCNSCIDRRSNIDDLTSNCNGCSDPDYFCGYKSELNVPSCQDVVQSFSKINK